MDGIEGRGSELDKVHLFMVTRYCDSRIHNIYMYNALTPSALSPDAIEHSSSKQWQQRRILEEQLPPPLSLELEASLHDASSSQ